MSPCADGSGGLSSEKLSVTDPWCGAPAGYGTAVDMTGARASVSPRRSTFAEGVRRRMSETGLASFVQDVNLLFVPTDRCCAHQRVSSYSVVFNTLQSTMGAGILSHAACFQYCGVAIALGLLVFLAACVCFSVKLLLSTVLILRSLPVSEWGLHKEEKLDFLRRERVRQLALSSTVHCGGGGGGGGGGAGRHSVRSRRSSALVVAGGGGVAAGSRDPTGHSGAESSLLPTPLASPLSYPEEQDFIAASEKSVSGSGTGGGGGGGGSGGGRGRSLAPAAGTGSISLQNLFEAEPGALVSASSVEGRGRGGVVAAVPQREFNPRTTSIRSLHSMLSGPVGDGASPCPAHHEHAADNLPPDEFFCTFEEVGDACYGRAGRVWVQGTYILMCMVALTSFVVPLKFFLETVMKRFDWFVSSGVTEDECLLVALVAVMVPLSLLRSVGKLWVTSLLGVACVTAFVVCSVVLTYRREMRTLHHDEPVLHCVGAPAGHNTPTGAVKFANLNFGQLLTAVSVFSCSFVCQLSLFPLFREVRVAEGDVKASSKVFKCTAVSLLVITLFYAAAGSSGYLMWREVSTKPSSILACYDTADPGILCVYVGMILCLMFAFPLVLVSARDTVTRLLFGLGSTETALWQHLAGTFALVVPVAAVGFTARTITSVLGVGGSFAAPPLTFTIPPAMYLRAHSMMKGCVESGDTDYPLEPSMYKAAMVLLCVGVVVQITAIMGSFMAFV